MDNEPVRQTTTTERVATDSGVTEQTVSEIPREERPVTPKDDHTMNVASRFVWFIAGVIIALLALRFLLRLLGANPSNGFADFVYSVSNVFAAPFLGLFGSQPVLETGRFEFETIIAMLVYALIAWGLSKLFTLGKR